MRFHYCINHSVLIYLILLFVILCSGSNPNKLRIPQIGLKWKVEGTDRWYFENQDLHHSVTFQNNAEEMILNPSVKSIILICLAYYPVHWTTLSSFGGGFVYLHRTSEDFNDPETYVYYSYLMFSHTELLTTGSYTCRSTSTRNEDLKLEATRFIFWEGARMKMVYGERPVVLGDWISDPDDGSTQIDNRDGLICRSPSCKGIPSKTVRADKENQTIILPCAVNSPTTTVKLYKRSEGGVGGNTTLDYNEIDWKNIRSGMIFDTKIGFIIHVGEQVVPPYGIYKCVPSTTYEVPEVLIVNVTMGVEVEAECKATENDTLFGNAKYSFTTGDDKYGSRIVCCSNGTKPPHIYKHRCDTKDDCDNLRKELQEFKFIDTADIRTGNCRSSSPLDSSFHIDNTIGVFRCFGDGIDVTREYYIPPTSNNENANKSIIYYDGEIYNALMERAADHDLIIFYCEKPSKVDRNVLFATTNASVTLTCYSSDYLLAQGVRWSIVWQNKTTQLIPENGGWVIMTDDAKDIGDKLTVMASKDIHSVICHAPLYNSSHWLNQTLFFNITDGIAPKIKGPAFERLTWVVGDTNKSLTCQATGVPSPSYIWEEPVMDPPYTTHTSSTFYEKLFKWTRYNNNRVAESGEWNSTLRFKRVLSTMDGNYTCTALNFQGGEEAKTTKTFMVIVTNKSDLTFQVETSTNTPIYQIEDEDRENVRKTNVNDTVTSDAGKTNQVHGSGLGTGAVISICLSVLAIIGVLIGGGLICIWRKIKSDSSTSNILESEISDTVSYKNLTHYNSTSIFSTE